MGTYEQNELLYCSINQFVVVYSIVLARIWHTVYQEILK